MRISDWSSDVCASDLPALCVSNFCARTAAASDPGTWIGPPLSPDLARFVLNHNRPDLFGTGFCTRDGHGYRPGTPRARSCARTRPTEIRSFFNLRTSTLRLLTKTLLATAALAVMPMAANAETDYVSGTGSASADLDFQIIIPRILFLQHGSPPAFADNGAIDLISFNVPGASLGNGTSVADRKSTRLNSSH